MPYLQLQYNLMYVFFVTAECIYSYLLLARDLIYTSCTYATMSVSVCLRRKCIGTL